MGIIFNNPLIGVAMCQIDHHGHLTQSVHNKYLTAITQAGGVPLALPQQLCATPHLLEQALATLDGVLLTGSTSNIEHADPGRDRLAFALITWATSRRMPLFGICRGMQELVVANGGALWRDLDQRKTGLPHHAEATLPLSEQYAPAHDIFPEADGLLASLLGGDAILAVNSLHHQGIRETGPQLRIEARAPDGLIEAVSLRHHPFALAVQWHPEWQPEQNDASRALFAGFIHAARHYHEEKSP